MLLPRSGKFRLYEHSVITYLSYLRECDWLDGPRCCSLILCCRIAFGLHLGIAILVLSSGPQLQHPIDAEITQLEIREAVNPLARTCEFDLEDVDFVTSISGKRQM